MKSSAQYVRDGGQAANPVDHVAAHGYPGAKRELHSFQQIRHQDSRRHFDRHAQGFHPRPEIPVRRAGIKTGDEADVRIEQRRNDLAKEVGGNQDIAVADYKMIIGGGSDHPVERKNLCIRPNRVTRNRRCGLGHADSAHAGR